MLTTWIAVYRQIAEQDKILAARRSNNELDTTKIQAALPDIHIMDIHTSCEKVPTPFSPPLPQSVDTQGWKPRRQALQK